MERAGSRLRGAPEHRGALRRRPGLSVGSLTVCSGDGGREAEGTEGDGRGWSPESESRGPRSHRTGTGPRPGKGTLRGLARPMETWVPYCPLCPGTPVPLL